MSTTESRYIAYIKPTNIELKSPRKEIIHSNVNNNILELFRFVEIKNDTTAKMKYITYYNPENDQSITTYLKQDFQDKQDPYVQYQIHSTHK